MLSGAAGDVRTWGHESAEWVAGSLTIHIRRRHENFGEEAERKVER